MFDKEKPFKFLPSCIAEQYEALVEVRELIIKNVRDCTDSEFLDIRELQLLTAIGSKMEYVYERIDEINDYVKKEND